MRARSMLILAAIAAAAVVLLLPGQASPVTPGTVQLAPVTPTNLVSETAAPALAAGHNAAALAEHLTSSSPSASLVALSPPQSERLAAERRPVPADLETEVRALHARLGTSPTAAELAAIAEADPALAASTAHLLAAIRVAADLREEALAALTSQERLELALALDAALEGARDRHLSAEERGARLARLEELASEVDVAAMAAAGIVVAEAVEDVVRNPPPTTMGAGGDVILSLLGGQVIVGGPGTTTYSGFNILVLDLGGNDLYEDTAGGAGFFTPFPVSVVLDLGGDDDYHPTPVSPTSYYAANVQGSGSLGVGVLVDVAGNDRYSSGMTLASTGGDVDYTLLRAQGFGSLGVGLLADLLGDDQYASSIALMAQNGKATYRVAAVQGAAMHGVGLLIDASGADAYNSRNTAVIDVEKGKAFTIWSAQYCQGAAVSGGAGVHVDGVLPDTQVKLSGLGYADAFDLLGRGADAYNSYNFLSTTLATTTAGFTGTTDGLAQMFNLNCQGATDGVSSSARIDKLFQAEARLPLALGLLVDLSGDDAFASANSITTRGVNRGGVQDSCAACHLGADFTTRASQGATGVSFAVPREPGTGTGGGGTPGPESPGLSSMAGVMVEVLGNDQYNSANQMTVDGITFALRPGQTNGAATYRVEESIGHAGSQVRSYGSPTPISCDIFGTGAHGCPSVGCSAEVGFQGMPPGASCSVGVHLDFEGDDRYNSYNDLAACCSDDNWEEFVVHRSLGAAEAGGIALHLDGPVGAWVGTYSWVACSASAQCSSLVPPFAPLIVAGSSGSDQVNSFNTARGARVFSLSENLGAGQMGGLAVAADVSPGIVVWTGAFVDPPSLYPFVGFGVGAQDLYNSFNDCPGLDMARNFGWGSGLAGVFVELGGYDVYGWNLCGGTVLESFGYADVSGGVGLFADAGGWDYYPTVAPAPGPLLFLPAGGPSDETGWDYGTWLLRIGWGIDLLSFV